MRSILSECFFERIFLKNKSNYCSIVIHKWQDKAMDAMNKMEEEERKEEESHKIIPIFLSHNVKNKKYKGSVL